MDVQSQQVVGWIEAIVTHHLHADTAVETSGLVVSETHRCHDIGKELVYRIETWTRSNRIPLLRVLSNAIRTRTHQFYQDLAFSHVKTSLVFEKQL